MTRGICRRAAVPISMGAPPPGRFGRGRGRDPWRTRPTVRRAAGACCWRSSAPTRRASIRTRRAPSPTSSWWRRSTARCCSSTRTTTRRSSATSPRSGRSRPTASPTPSSSVQGIRFHDGSPLTSADVKATYDKIIFPPQGVRSVRKNAYTAVERVEAPDPSTVVFKLKFPSASLLANLASPWNVIFPKKYLDQDPNYFKTHVVGSGPFKFKGYTRGSTFEGERNPDYFVKDRPYLDGYKFFISPETSVRAAAIRSGRAYIEFREPAQRRGRGDPQAARRQGRRPGNADDRPVGHRDQQHREAVQRRARPQGAHPGHRSVHDEQGAGSAHRAQVRRRA